jgi:Holliday junction resolvase RusA-like endonuclease
MDNADSLRALTLLAALAAPLPAERVVVLVHPGAPIAKERPRFNRKTGSVFTPRRTKNAEEALAWAIVAARGPRPAFPGAVALVALFYVPARHPKDIDNLLKLVMDAGNQSLIWRDDRNVRILAAAIDVDAAAPRTVVALAPYGGGGR